MHCGYLGRQNSTATNAFASSSFTHIFVNEYSIVRYGQLSWRNTSSLLTGGTEWKKTAKQIKKSKHLHAMKLLFCKSEKVSFLSILYYSQIQNKDRRDCYKESQLHSSQTQYIVTNNFESIRAFKCTKYIWNFIVILYF